ncbi:hypothetical protein EMIHUDRAFT_229856 [Emiliania huxleyi CCMP1516]|uniref:Uncharacterized protein n=2 Tax=Emiliania huxleyi TaxID=2903 RepID=A0A0D3KC26_EMIH1|nr:hypothetical protein EMIHUDRAFT_229856 [Emiliania huxleyi CCMP1516]EOD33311.1 hypothetical protein EMIHUDRAFT_229856 [Emiliania huxleyi CCMP1516]|eukprot:XP_005785740.1 hypothetical protein EMIHUDRAFT_229856 [Emiliania huxleyi CCMP1516]
MSPRALTHALQSSVLVPESTLESISCANPDILSREQSWQHFTQGVEKQGADLDSTSRFLYAWGCKFAHLYASDGPLAKPDTQTSITEITYLTDGSCGSTCSLAALRPILDGVASSVSFGGLANTPVAVSSFNGGIRNPQWQGKETINFIQSAVDLSVLKPSISTPPRDAPVLLVPLNTQLTFTMTAQYHTALGDNAKPSEFYRIPASHHLNVWDLTENSVSQQNFVDSADAMRWLAENLYIPAAKKPFTTYPKPDLGDYEKGGSGCPGTGASGENSDSTRQLLFGSVPGDHSPPPSPPAAPLDCWPYDNPEEECSA